jgi:dienelactone hydrolase
MNIHINENGSTMPIVIFAHGYKGFKDFGAWSLIGDQMADKGIVFIRFNFSHNGTSLENPTEFDDLEAFGQNNYSMEVDEFNLIIDHIYNLAKESTTWNENNISIIGHSRGGGMSILSASENKHVKSLITWAAIDNTYNRMPIGDALEKWKKEGVSYVLNGRTKQQMPHYYQFYEDLISHKDRLDIEKAAKSIKIPWLIIHGDNDETVPLGAAKHLHEMSNSSQLLIIKNANHTFSIKHPWTNKELSKGMQIVIDQSINFIKNNKK